MAGFGIVFDAKKNYSRDLGIERPDELVAVELLQNLKDVSLLKYFSQFLPCSLQDALLLIDRMLRGTNFSGRSQLGEITISYAACGKCSLEIGTVDERVLGSANASALSNVTECLNRIFEQLPKKLIFCFAVNACRKQLFDHAYSPSL
jgi:hypothetical protein